MLEPPHSCVDQTVDEIVGLFVAIGRTLQRRGVPAWLQQLDLTIAQLRVLFWLAHEGPVTIGRLAELLGVGQPTASHLVDRLVRAQLVARTEDPHDRRYTLARLTERGEEMVEMLHQARRDWLRTCLARLGADERAALLHGIRALARVCQADLAAPGLTAALYGDGAGEPGASL
jgi:DNA-binding MarR family transcriptional regulator